MGEPRVTGRPWERIRQEVFRSKGRRCLRPLPPDGRPCGKPATDVGHIIPAEFGGTDDLDNLRPECVPCNRGEGSHIAHRKAASSRKPRRR